MPIENQDLSADTRHRQLPCAAHRHAARGLVQVAGGQEAPCPGQAPEANGCIFCAGHRHRALLAGGAGGAGGDAHHGSCVAVQRAALSHGCRIPHADGAVGGGREHHAAVPRQRQAAHLAPVALVRAGGATPERLRVPHPHGAIRAPGQQPSAVLRSGQALCPPGVALQPPDVAGGGWVPRPNCPLCRTAHHSLPITAERHSPPSACRSSLSQLFAPQRRSHTPRLRVPHPQRSAFVGGHHAVPGRAPGHPARQPCPRLGALQQPRLLGNVAWGHRPHVHTALGLGSASAVLLPQPGMDCRQGCAGAAQCKCHHRQRVLHNVGLRAAEHVPHTHRLVPAARDQSRRVRGEGRACHRVRVPSEHVLQQPSAEVPQPQRGVLAGGGQMHAVRAHCHRGDRARVAIRPRLR
mmetsp:Transcript_39593/g.86270  ORF Transcript_39593/g.86270 Transcript_39593/m.86270 type:complete len:408 (-) Transcript_39593:207-1430(-)